MSLVGFSIEDIDTGLPLNEQISEWVYSELTNIDSKDHDHVLIEIKFGEILNRSGGRYTTNESEIIKDRWKTRFSMNIDKSSYDEIGKFLHKFEKKHNLIKDTIFNCGFIGGKVRISNENDVEVSYEKKRIADLLITFSKYKYDLKIALSLGIPNTQTRITSVKKLYKPEMTRVKDRFSWIDSEITYEATKVETKKKDTITAYECELDLDAKSVYSKNQDEFKKVVENYFGIAVSLNKVVSNT